MKRRKHRAMPQKKQDEFVSVRKAGSEQSYDIDSSYADEIGK